MSFDLLAVGGTGVAFTLEYLLARRKMPPAQQQQLARILLLDPDETDSLRGLMLDEARAQRVEVKLVDLSEEVGDRTLEDALKESGALTPLMRVLLTSEDRAVPFKRGMMGRPKVASTILSRPLKDAPPRIDTIMAVLAPPPQVSARLVVGSIAGGTGAGLIPFLCRRLRDPDSNLREADGRVLDLHVLALLPWFDPDGTTGYPSQEVQRANARGGILALRTFMSSVRGREPDQGERTWVYVVGPANDAIKNLRRPKKEDVEARGMVSPVLRDVALQVHGLIEPQIDGARNRNTLEKRGLAVLPSATVLDPVGSTGGYFRGLALALSTLAGWKVEELVSGGPPRLGGMPEIIERPLRAAVRTKNAGLVKRLTEHWEGMSASYLKLSDDLYGAPGAGAAAERGQRRLANEARYTSSKDIAELLDHPAEGRELARTLADMASVVDAGTQDAEHGAKRYRQIAEVVAAVLERRLFADTAPIGQDATSIKPSITVPVELLAASQYNAQTHGQLVRFILTDGGIEALLGEYSKGAPSFSSASIASPLAVVHAAVDAATRKNPEVIDWCRVLWVAAVRGWLSFSKPTSTDEVILRADEAWLSEGLRVVSIGNAATSGVPVGITTPQLGFVPAAGVLDRSTESIAALLKALKEWSETMAPGGAQRALQEAVRGQGVTLEDLKRVLRDVGQDEATMRDQLAGFVAFTSQWSDQWPAALDEVALWRSAILGTGSGTCNQNGPVLKLAFNAASSKGLRDVHIPALHDTHEIVDFDGRPWRRPSGLDQREREISLALSTRQLSSGDPASTIYDSLEFEKHGKHPFPLVPGVCFERTGDDSRTPKLYVWAGTGESYASWNKGEYALTMRGRIGTEHVTVRVTIPRTIPVEEVSFEKIFIPQPGCISLVDQNGNATSTLRWVDVPVVRRYLPLVKEVVEAPGRNEGRTPVTWKIRFRGGVEGQHTIRSLHGALNRQRLPIAIWPNPAGVGGGWRFYSVLLGQVRGSNNLQGWVMTRDSRSSFVSMWPLEEGVTNLTLGPARETMKFLYLFGPDREFGAFQLPAPSPVLPSSKAYVALDFGTSNTSLATRSSNDQVDGTPVSPGGPTPLVLSPSEVGAPSDAIWLNGRPWLASTRQKAPVDTEGELDFIPTLLVDRLANTSDARGIYSTRCQVHPQENHKAFNGSVLSGFKWRTDPDSVAAKHDHLEISLLTALAGAYSEAEVRASYPLALAPSQRNSYLQAVTAVGRSLESKTGIEIKYPPAAIPVDETTVMLYGLLDAFQDRAYDAKKLHVGVAIDIGGGTVDLLVAPLASLSHGTKDWSQFLVLAAGSVRYGADLLAQNLAAMCGYRPEELQVAIRRGLAETFHTERPTGELGSLDAFVADVSPIADKLDLVAPAHGWKVVGGAFSAQVNTYYFRDVLEYAARSVAGAFLDAENFKYRAEHARRTETRWSGTPAAPDYDPKNPLPVVVHYLLSGNGWGWLGDARKQQWVANLHRRIGDLLAWNTGSKQSFVQWGTGRPTHSVVGKAAVARFLATGRNLKNLNAGDIPLECVSEGLFGKGGLDAGSGRVSWFRQMGPGAPPDAMNAPDLPEDVELGDVSSASDLESWMGPTWKDAVPLVVAAQSELRSQTGARASAMHVLYEEVLYKHYTPEWISGRKPRR